MALGGGKIEWSQEAPPREKIMFVVVLGMMLYAFSVWLWGPQRAQTKIVQKEVDVLQTQTDALETILSAAAKKSAAPVVAVPIATPQRDPIATDPRFASYLKGEFRSQEQVLQDVSAELATPKVLGKVVLGGINFGDAVDKGDYREIPFDLRIEGSYQDTVSYLQRIEKIPILVVYRGVHVQAKTDNPSQLESQITAAAFVVKSAAALTDANGTGGTP